MKISTSGNNSSVKDYIKLMKPRVMSLVVFTSFSGMWLAPGIIHPFIGFVAMLCITLGAGSSAAINMWYDRDIDAVMTRTRQRPIITGRVLPDEALSFGIIMAFFSVFFMAFCINMLAAGLLLFTILYYVIIYTIWLKRSSIQNIVVGGVAGALPPMIGWAAVTNEISFQSIILFLIIFTWTPPHSWALALFRLEDYKKCGVPMMPVIKGEYYTKKQIVIYSIIMVVVSLMPYYLGMSDAIYLVITLILDTIFLYYVASLFKDKPFNKNSENIKGAKNLFIYSIFYLFVVFLALDIYKIS